MKHVFITGCPRSGTTMLASILGNGDSCLTTPESHFFNDFIYKFLSTESAQANKTDLETFFDNHYRFKQWQINSKNIKDIPNRITYANYNFVIENTVKLFAKTYIEPLDNELIRIDHTPSNIISFDIINELFPEAKFIFIVRDPRAVYASIKNLDWGPNSPLKLSQLWIEYTSAYFAVQKLYPEKICLVKYEDLINNSISEIKKICNFIELGFDNNLLEGGGFKIPEYTFSQHALVGKALNKSRIDKWKKELKKEDIKLIESKCGVVLKTFNYKRSMNTKYKISKKDKLVTEINELYYSFQNMIKKKGRENKA